jgi:exosortase/archaeosortase family protein
MSPWTKASLVLATCAALHPVFTWTALRAVDGSDEPWGVGALVAVVALIAMRHREVSGESSRLGLGGPALWLAVYAVTYPWLTPLPRGTLAMTALALLLSRFYFGAKLNLGLLVLLLLGLPLIASIQFYLGYPLRVVVAGATAGLLRLGGFDVNVVGVGLELGAQTITVDAPCSGVKMLWVGGFAASLLAVLKRLSVRETLLFMVGTAACLFVANVLRAAALFYVELRLVTFPEVTHSAVGLVMFAVALAMIAMLSRLFQGARNHA